MDQKKVIARVLSRDEKDPAYKTVVNFCGGCLKGKCFHPNDGLLVWRHLKDYRDKDIYEKKVLIVQASCLGVCVGGPILQVLDLSGQNTPIEYRLSAGSVEEANQIIDRIMEEHVLGGVPVQEFLDNWPKE